LVTPDEGYFGDPLTAQFTFPIQIISDVKQFARHKDNNIIKNREKDK
jgi:hypothetical protein